MIRSASSVGANYRAASRAISDKAMYSKLKIVEEEADETQFWLEVLNEVLYPEEKQGLPMEKLMNEAGELTAIFSASVRTLRKRLQR